MPKPDHDALHRLLVDLCRRDAPSTLGPRVLEPLRSDDAWTAFLERATAHRVGGVVLTALERLSKASPEVAALVPGPRLAPLRLLRRQALGWDLEQARVLAWLGKHGIEPIVLKGCALRHTCYGESAERPVSDLDLLFESAQLNDARVHLAALGYVDPNSDATNALYRRHHFHLQMEHPGGFAIELHWALTPPGPRGRIDPIDVRTGATRIAGATLPFKAACPEHTVLHLASQAAEGSLSHLGRIVDIDRIVAEAGDDFDWGALAEVARRGDLENAVAVATSMAAQLFGTPVPPDFPRALGVSGWSRRNLRALDPVRWILDQTALRYMAAGVVMRFWLESTAAARADVLLQACGLRRNPMRLLDRGREDAPESAGIRLRMRVPTVFKIASLQAAAWLASATPPAPRALPRLWDRPEARSTSPEAPAP
ncbi:nucleotidyltransferase family protein [Gemmatimonadota bacterium Y43]|uniref:nucleotidyltransferase family protein n=1 Tax=Gaopeijia maritima TaxID=3119007 RepID=UPI0032803010